MAHEEIILDYILNDGQVISINVDFDESPSATITIRGRKRNSDKKIENKIIELRLTNLIQIDVVDDFSSSHYSDITLTRLENGCYYLSFDPYDNTNEPNSQDNFVFKCKGVEIKEPIFKDL